MHEIAPTLIQSGSSPRVSAPSDNRRRASVDIPDRVDVAIVGSGPGGLTAAAYLAQAGLSVAVFEAHYTAGGCATQLSRGPKGARYRFDVGLHYVGDCREDGTIPRILADLHTPVDFVEMDPLGFDTLVFPDLRFRIPASLELYRARLVEAFPREKRGIDKYVGLVRSVMKVSRMMDVHEGRRPPLLELARLALDGLRLAPLQKATMADVLDACTQDPQLRAVLLGQSGDYGLPPTKVSALLHLGLAGHYFRGAFYPRGGGQVIADRLCDRVEQLGGSVHVRTPVEKILVEGGRAVGVRLSAKAGAAVRDVRANLVVSNADLKRTLLDLVGPQHLPSEWITRARGFEMAASLFMTFVGLRGDPGELGMTSSNTWQFDGYDVEAFYRDASDRSASASDGPIQVHGCYVTSASAKDPSNPLHHAPLGHTNVEIMALVPSNPARWSAPTDAFDWSYKHSDAYRARKQGVEEDLVRRLHALFPGTVSRVDLVESATPMTQARFTGASDGCGYGLAATPAQFMKSRPGYRGPVSGLYFVGASTRAGHGIVGAMMGGRAGARRIVSDLQKQTVQSRPL